MDEKLITFAIPSYNSEAYMRKCIDSILTGGDEVEIIIVDDGSKDGTGAIADEYERTYPNICRAVHQENGGHGEGVNQGMRRASGLYYKVVDSDDWVDEKALAELLATVRRHKEEGTLPDLYITNFIYDRVCDNESFTRRYTKNMPTGEFFGWDKVKRFRGSSVLLMHALMYKTSVLRECGLSLPKHTFYVDNIFAYVPLPYVKTMFYLNADLYHYYIGRADQSVNISSFSKRTDQQNRVMRIMAEAYDLREIGKTNKQLKKYMEDYESILEEIKKEKEYSVFGEPLLDAVFNSDLIKVKKCVFSGKYNIDVQDDKGYTPLMYAIMNHNFDIVEFLVDHGADINLCNFKGQSPLKIAYRYDDEKIASYLLEKGAIDNNLEDKKRKYI